MNGFLELFNAFFGIINLFANIVRLAEQLGSDDPEERKKGIMGCAIVSGIIGFLLLAIVLVLIFIRN